MFPFLSVISAGFWKQRRDVVPSMENAVSKSSLYSRTTDYIEGESPHLPKDLDHSLGIAREEVCHKFSNPNHALDHLFLICHIQFFDTFAVILRLCPRKKKCWTGRGSMRTAVRRWWRWGKWGLRWHYITARIESKDLTPHCFSFEWEVVTKCCVFRLLLSLFRLANWFMTLKLSTTTLGSWRAR